MTRRKHISTRERLRLFQIHGGVCHICETKIHGEREKWDVEHVIPFAMTQDDSDTNRKPAHVTCHKAKTKDDIRIIRKSDRQRANFMGAKAPTRNPIPGSKASKWKKKMDGTVVPR